MSNLSRKRAVLFSLGLLFLILLLFGLRVGLFVWGPAEKGAPGRVVVVREGLSLGEVAEALEGENIILSRSLFLLWARLTGAERKIKAGEYLLSPGMTPLQILRKLTRGLVVTHGITIPEGFIREQIAELLEIKGLVDKAQFLALTGDGALLKQYGLSGRNLEGYLYPDTYHFARGLSPRTVIDAMVRRFLEVVRPLQERIRDSDMPLENVVTLASIVEKETGRAEERPLIASVFLNRLRKGMRLDSDPTVIYGLKGFNGNLTRKDLNRPTPYNTYVIRGLPPGPIANPGLDAIKAVLYPAESKYLYFVSKNDGSHHFSNTLSEHNRAVNLYQRKKRSGPPKIS
jgi:UPF0755 protein